MTTAGGLPGWANGTLLEVAEHERPQPGESRCDGQAEVVDLSVGKGVGDAFEGEEENGVGFGTSGAPPATQACQESELAAPLRPIGGARRLVGCDEGAQAGA